MTSDGTNSYAWDCENRLIKITYPGTGNYSTFAYDGFSRNVQILEYASSSLTSTKNFVWSGNGRCEYRSATGTVSSQYFARGETIGGTNYYWTRDDLDSVRELTNNAGAIEWQVGYDPYGRPSAIQQSVSADVGFGGYYVHAASGLNLTETRAYNAAQGRFISRDTIGERGGVNLFGYAENSPTNVADPEGTAVSAPQAPVQPSEAIQPAPPEIAPFEGNPLGGGIAAGAVVVVILGIRFYLTVENPLPDLSNLKITPTDQSSETNCKKSCDDIARAIIERFRDEYRKANIFQKNKFDKDLDKALKACEKLCEKPKPQEPSSCR